MRDTTAEPMSQPDRRDVLRAALEAVGTRLADAEVWHCLAFGTLLGAVRDHDVIDWDHDIDLLTRPCELRRIAACSDEHVSFTPMHMPASRMALRPGGPGALETVQIPGLSLSVDGVAVGELWAPVLFSDGVLRIYDLECEVALWPQSALPAFVLEQALRSRGFGTRLSRSGARGNTTRMALRRGLARSATRGRRTVATSREVWALGDRVAPALAEQIAWCEAQGWDRFGRVSPRGHGHSRAPAPRAGRRERRCNGTKSFPTGGEHSTRSRRATEERRARRRGG